MNTHFRTTGRIAALMASSAILHTRDDDPISELSRTITENNQAMMEQLRTMQERQTVIERDVNNYLNRVIPAVSRRAGIEPTLTTARRSVGLDQRPRGSVVENAANTEALRAEREAIGEFIRSGGADIDELATELGALETRDGMSVSSDPDGGYLVTPAMADAIRRRQFDVSPIARLARRVTLATGDAFEETVDSSDIGAEWVEEKEARPELDATKLKKMRVPLNEIYTLQPITQRLMDDSSYNLGAYIEEKISDKFARKAGQAFINGDGNKKPEGLLFRPSSPLPDGERDFFVLQHVNTGVGDGWPASDPADVLIDLVYTLRAPYRANARWLMNLKTAGVVRKMKDTEGNNIWANSLAAGQPALLLGYPVEIDEEMPDIGDDTVPIAFGDFQQGYIVIDRPGTRILIDPYTRKPYVLFYGYHRIGGQVQNGEAIKLLRFAASG